MNYIASIANQVPGKFLVAKHPVEDFNDGSILTVNPGETALFVNNGVIGGMFLNGRYELSTQNYPFINSFRRFLANGQLTYHCAVYFISEAQSCEVLWGFPLTVRDPIQSIFTKIFIRGSYTVRVHDAGKLLIQLLGMNVNFMAASDVKVFFGNRFQQHISNILAQYISQSGREILDICSDNLSITEKIEPKLRNMIEYSGLEISNFAISAMQIDQNDPNRRILEQAYAKCREREILGEEYMTIKDTDIRTNASLTPFAGMSFGVSPNNSMVNQPFQQSARASYSLNNNEASALTSPTNNADEEFLTRLQQVKKMFEKGLIDEEEYKTIRQQLLSKMV